ncbi:conserved Plasmodium protein, unknown function [Plasmodium ovale]|uniref:Fam-a protein n=1 Tax=Plasmodium ovale TaxID=36330 RepID=A0A1D3TKI7_PLAOA|nr:conserved Plasmodium protein, unknown function [Plasmodium ovale]
MNRFLLNTSIFSLFITIAICVNGLKIEKKICKQMRGNTQLFEGDPFGRSHSWQKYTKKGYFFRKNNSLHHNDMKKKEKKKKEICNAIPFCSIKIPNWKIHLKRIIQKYVLLKNDKETDNTIHPLKNCLWEINIYNFFLQKQTSFHIYIYENGKIKTSDNLEGTWFYDNYHITWCVEHEDRKVYYTAELLWNNENSKLIKGIIYEEKKKKRSFLPSSFFRKILGSFEGKIHI